MKAYRPDRVVKLLSALATGLYFVTWVAVVLVLVAIPVVRVLGVAEPDSRFAIEAPVTVHLAPETGGAWRIPGAKVVVSQVRGTASIPVSSLSGAAMAVMWLAFAAFSALALLFLHQLRRLFQRVRQGAPFDPANAVRLRWLGILLAIGAVWKSVSDCWISLAVSRMLEGPGDRLGTTVDLNVPVLVVALVLIALAEVFRRGAALEDEQALVV